MRWVATIRLEVVTGSSQGLSRLATHPVLVSRVWLMRVAVALEQTALNQPFHAHPCSLEIGLSNLWEQELGRLSEANDIIGP